MKLHQTKKLLHSKRNNQQNEKATCRMGENICKPSNKGLISKLYKELIQLNSKEKTNLKNGQRK